MTRNNNPIGLKLTLIFSILATIGFTTIVVYVPWLLTAKKNVQDVVRQANDAAAQSTTQEVDRIFSNVFSAQQLIIHSAQRQMLDLSNDQSRSMFFLSILQANPNFTWVQYGDSKGDFVGAQRDLDGFLKYHYREWDPKRKQSLRKIETFAEQGDKLNLIDRKIFESSPFYSPDRPWYKSALEARGKQAWSVYVYASNNTPGIDSSITLERNASVEGVVGIGVELKWISFYLHKANCDHGSFNRQDTTCNKQKEGVIFIVNAKNELIAASDLDELTLTQAPGQVKPELRRISEASNPHLQYVSKLLVDRQVNISSISTRQDYLYKEKDTGKEFFVSLSPLNKLDWVVGTVVPASIYYSAIERNNALLGTILLGLILLTSFTIVYIADRSLAQPITLLTEAAAKVAGGDLDVTVPVIGKNEIGKLAKAFNQMTGELKNSQGQLEEFNRTLELRVEERTGELKAVLGNMVDGLAVVNPQNSVIQFNAALLKMLHRTAEEVYGQPAIQVFEQKVSALIEESRTNQHHVYNTEIAIHEGFGKASISSICIADPHQEGREIYLGAIILLRDITFEKQVDRMKTDFVSSVSHELRTPLTSVLGFARLIQKKLEESIFPVVQSEDKKVVRAIRQVTENIDIIVSEGNRLTKLINDVLDIAKMEAGKIDWNMEPMHISEVIDRALAATAALFENKGIRSVRDIAQGIPITVGDKNRLIQVVINLISNAVKFQEEGAIICQACVENGQVVVRVIDQGMGIAPEDIPKVFEKFKQVGDTLTNKPQGTGLGLPICKEIVEHHQGILWAESTIGKGSTFYFTLPIVAKTNDNS